MKPIRVMPIRADRVKISGIGADMAYCLRQIPAILSHREDAKPRRRLFPDPMPGHSEDNEAWHETVEPELRHLFEAAERTLAADLAGLRSESLVLPAAHLDAWRSAINQARLVLAEVHGVTESDMEKEKLDPADARDLALMQIHVLGYLLHELTQV